MQAAADDADHLAKYSDATYPVGPDKSGEITYVHIPPLNPLSSACDPASCRLGTPPDVCARSSTHRRARLHGSRGVRLVLHPSSGPEVPPHQDRRATRHQATDGFGVRAVALRLAPKGAADDAAAARALRAGAGHAHRAAAARRESLAGVVALALAYAFALVVVVVEVAHAGDAPGVLAAVFRARGRRRPCGREHSGRERREPHDAQEGRRAL